MKIKHTSYFGMPVNINGKLYRALERRYVDPIRVKEEIFKRYKRGDLSCHLRNGELHLTETPLEDI